MSAIIHVVLGPPGSDRTGRLLAAYREAAVGFGTALFLTLMPRHADQVRTRLDTRISPLVFDLQAFADELVRIHEPTLRPHADTDRRILLDALLTELRESGELPYFAGVAETRGFVDAAEGYVTELKEAGIDLRPLLKASPTRDSGASPNRHVQATRIFDRYHRRLGKLHRFDPPDRLGRAAELWSAGKQRPFGRVQSVFVAGFTGCTSYQRKLLDAIRETVEHFWLELPDGEGETFTNPRATRAWITAPVGELTLVNPPPEVLTERVECEDDKPIGLRQLVRLFGGNTSPTDEAPTSSPIDGLAALRLIEAPGELGEARLVARQIRTLLADNVLADRIIVVARQLTRATVELFHEVFDEYAITHDVEGAETLSRVPAVTFLLQAWRLAEEDWPFAHVAAILRSTYFRPNWLEVQADPEVAAKAETLLRMLGEPRGREAYLGAARAWEHTPPDALEDEQAEEPVRKRKQRLAVRCRPFLERFFRAWDRLKSGGTAEAIVARMKAFANDLGLTVASQSDPADSAGLARFWVELDRWARAETGGNNRKVVRPERFARVLSAVTSIACRARTSRDAGQVRFLSAESAAGLDCDYLFLVGLGEGSWPDLSAPTSLLDDPERTRLRTAGLPLPDPASRLASEQLLFLMLVTAPRRGLFLSYPAVDEQGQPLLPSSFLRELKNCFPPDAIPTTRQRMLLDGYFDQEPLSAAELRVRVARHLTAGTKSSALAPELLDNLHRAAKVAQARFQSHAFGPYDGELRHQAVAVELAKRFASEKIVSPTSLETYVACPFRFWLEHVLRLEPHEDPVEEVEHTRRGAAFHRALARFHNQLKELIPKLLAAPELPDGITEELLRQIERAVEEYAARAPSRATAELWRLEGQRLRRAGGRYRGHWHEFRKPWREKNATPTPFAFEADFGVPGENVPEPLVIVVGDVEVRIGGRIDRVDLAEIEGTVGFWVIDYKTGRGINYQASQVERFEKLQLPLYALAVERVLLKNRPARPLGLAYWLVTDTGHKPMLPSGKRAILSWLADPGRWERFRTQLEKWVASLMEHVRAGDFPLAPRSEHCTDTCAFGPVCRIAQSRNTGKVFPLPLPLLPKEKDAKAEG